MRRLLIALAVAALAACSTYEGMMGTPAAPTKTMDGVLTNSAGMTLYTFDKDADRQRQERVQRPLRGQLAAADGRRGFEGVG